MGLLAREGSGGKGSSGDGARGGSAADGGLPVCLGDRMCPQSNKSVGL